MKAVRKRSKTPPKRSASRPASKPAAERRKKSAGDSAVTLTNPQRVLYPDIGLTKEDLADYYAAFADLLLLHVAGRPLSLLRCPEGVDKACFFQKHAAAGTPPVLGRVPIEEQDGVAEYLVVMDAEGLRALAQMSILEIHPWGSRAESV